jgi:hypothetical protein
MNQATDLINLKEKIETAKIKKNRLEGEKEGLHKTLEKDYGVSTLSEAKVLLETKEKQLVENQKILDTQVGELENNYNWHLGATNIKGLI